MRKACIFIVYAYCCLFLLTGYEQGREVPTEIEKVDLKLNNEEVAITFLSLSNGEATLVQNEKGEGLLINSGHEESQLELKKYLDVYGITQINTIVLTKLDPHYMGNLHYLISQYKIQHVIIPFLSENAALPSVNIPNNKWKEGDQDFEQFGLSIQVLQIDQENKGMDLLLKYGEHRFLFMANANESQELELTKKFNLKDVNILKVAEFAKKTGTSQRLLEEVDPQVAIIFQRRNSYPSADVLERLQSTWIDIYYTKQFGNVTVKCKKDNYEVITLSVESLNRL
ncbi:ComEC/Rec2 family competence protein [Bacillus suaedaesalsae]|uniref:MBL fold metallo-hydrolase n=1 Tax=Bacillus suaedaesalsae TaxID=2810349 RepID=A0ABS2DMY3_9BACI|nr:hypothetical protein [Bacillus suaedaesalsae]MBM6619829.1 hypothetical protein [Bacillus suaedaesalsae]